MSGKLQRQIQINDIDSQLNANERAPSNLLASARGVGMQTVAGGETQPSEQMNQHFSNQTTPWSIRKGTPIIIVIEIERGYPTTSCRPRREHAGF